MEYRIVADSCCDLTPELKNKYGVISVPLTLTLGEKSYVDDDSLDLPGFMEDMKNCTERIGSAAPSPGNYKDAFLRACACFAVTLSSNLSGSFESAMFGKAMAEEEGAKVHVFDSKSASSGEILIVMEIWKMLSEGAHRAGIISSIESFINEMKTYFVLENLDNLVKNGRMNKITSKLISIMGIKPILGSDRDGNIALFSHSRNEKQTIQKLADTIAKSGKSTIGEKLVITHCNNPGLAEQLKDAIKKRYNFEEIFIFPTKGLSSLYANNKGIIMSF